MEHPDKINKILKKKYGKDVNGFAMYRIIQNTRSLTEKRKGTFNIFKGEIFLRTEKNVIKEVPKYTYVKHGFWILERLFYSDHPELASRASYEPLWVLNGKDGEYQEPNILAINFIIDASLRGPTKVLSEIEEDEKTANEIYEFLGGKPTLDGSIADGSAVSLAGLDARAAIKDT